MGQFWNTIGGVNASTNSAIASTSMDPLAETQAIVAQVVYDEPFLANPVVSEVTPLDATQPNPASFGGLVEIGVGELPGQNADGTIPPNASIPNASIQSTGETTLVQIESLAIASHPAIAEARARVESTRGQYIQAGLPFNPKLVYQGGEIGNDGTGGLHTVRMSQEFITANKLGLAQQVQAQEIQKQQARLRIAELQVLTKTRAAFAQTMVAQQRTEVVAQIVELAEKSVDSVEALVRAREVSNIELLQAKVEVERARIAAENAQTQLQANRRLLAAAAGISDLPGPRLTGDISENLTDAPWDVLLTDIESTSPELAEAGSELERARWALRLACAQVTPNITGLLGVGVDTGTDDAFGIAMVSIPLPIRNRNQGNIRSARADIAAASAAIDRTAFSLDARFADAIGRYQTARERYERLQSLVVPNARETYELSRKAFEAGETAYLQLLTAQRTLFDTQLSVLDALAQAKEAIAEIEGLLVTLQP